MEAMAQLGGIVMMDPEDLAAKKNFFFGGIEGCKFRRPVVPGDTLVSIILSALRHAQETPSAGGRSNSLQHPGGSVDSAAGMLR